ncbi:MAG: YerC/YecD family TrpR-related protein [Wujia sp.]
MEKTIRTQTVKEFLEAVLTLESVDECMDFFEDVCTVKEVQSIAQRFAVAKMLRQGRTYAEVAQETGASTATISRVNRSLNYGNESYDKIFERLKK